MPEENLPPPEHLQFRRAQSPGGPDIRACIACKQPISGEYFQANGNTVCPTCADRIRNGQQSVPPAHLAKAVLFGAGAALAGSAIYAGVAIFLHIEIGLVAVLIGYMVGNTVRFAAGVGRPQQILAVSLTYFAITSAFILTVLYPASRSGQSIDWSRALLPLLELLFVAPFLALFQGSNPVSALISLVIIFIGLRRAWAHTRRSEIIVTGPF
jgi:hypothetical protein